MSSHETSFGLLQRVRFIDSPDIECLVLAIIIEPGETLYRVAWWNEGSRMVDGVHEVELEAIP